MYRDHPLNIKIDRDSWRGLAALGMLWLGAWIAFGLPGVRILAGLHIFGLAVAIAPKPAPVAQTGKS